MEGTSDLIFKGRWKKRELSLVFGKHYQSRDNALIHSDSLIWSYNGSAG